MQGAFTSIIDAADRDWQERLDRYAGINRGKYLGFASGIVPEEYTKEEIYKRLVFSILSGQTPFDRACLAFSAVLKLTEKQRGNTRTLARVVKGCMYVKVKSLACKRAWELAGPALLRQEGEDWHTYRVRLTGLHGLGKAKASFAACLLYPLEADLACLDTWILKQFGLPPEKNGHLTWEEYEHVEGRIRVHAKRWHVPTFVAQWIIWDHARRTVESHEALMPGGHK